MTESIKDYNYIKRFGESVLCSLEHRSERITIDLYGVKKSTENVASFGKVRELSEKEPTSKFLGGNHSFGKERKKYNKKRIIT